MKTEQLVDMLTKSAGAKKDGAVYLVPDGHLSLYFAFPSDTLVVGRILRVEIQDPFVRLDTAKGERFVLPVEDVRGIKVEIEGAAGKDRSAGFTRV